MVGESGGICLDRLWVWSESCVGCCSGFGGGGRRDAIGDAIRIG